LEKDKKKKIGKAVNVACQGNLSMCRFGFTSPAMYKQNLVFTWEKWPGLALTTHYHLASRLKKVELCLYFPCRPSWQVIG
jgi:hypothetical protein